MAHWGLLRQKQTNKQAIFPVNQKLPSFKIINRDNDGFLFTLCAQEVSYIYSQSPARLRSYILERDRSHMRGDVTMCSTDRITNWPLTLFATDQQLHNILVSNANTANTTSNISLHCSHQFRDTALKLQFFFLKMFIALKFVVQRYTWIQE